MANIITFSTSIPLDTQALDKPIPIKLNIPEWYKKLKHTHLVQTVKGCMPFLDTLTTGYLLKVPQDIQIGMAGLTLEGEPIVNYKYSYRNRAGEINLNVDGQAEFHEPKQLEGSEFVSINNGRSFAKILNPWHIQTPKGYSCLFTPPLNNHTLPWSIIPGIVDTDTYEEYVNFPIIVDTEKVKNRNKDIIIEKGTPYVQVIPFKKESWQMKIRERKKGYTAYPLKLFNIYKSIFWKKTSWR